MRRIFFHILVASALFSCKKQEKDAVKPVVSISSPYSNQGFNVFDTISVKGIAEDETALTNITIVLLDENNIRAGAATGITPRSRREEINAGLIIDDIHLESGNYTLMVSASDGVNETHSYVKLYISEAPKERKGIFIISTPSTFTTNIYKTDSSFSAVNLYAARSGDYSASDISSHFQTLAVAGNFSGDLTCYNLTTGAQKWSQPAYSNSGLPTFFGVNYYDKRYYTSTYDGFIKGYEDNGISGFSASALSGYYPIKSCKTENFIIVEEKEKSGTIKKLAAYYPASGALVKADPAMLNMDVVDFCLKKGDDVFVFGNDANNQGHLKLFETATDNLWEPYMLPAGKVMGAARVDPDNFLIAHETGVYRYQYSLNSRTDFLPGVAANEIAYDDVLNEVIVAVGNRLQFYDYYSAAFKYEITCPEEIRIFHIWYNK